MATLTSRRPSSLQTLFARWLNRLAEIGALPDDTADDRLRKSILIFTVVLLGIVGLTIWVVLYWILDLRVVAAIPFTYQFFSALSLIYLARTKDFATFRSIELFMALTLPVSAQWALGGFAASGAVILWGAWPAIAESMLENRRQAVRWFGGYLILLVISALLDTRLAEAAPPLPAGVSAGFFILNIAVVIGSMVLALGYFANERDKLMAALNQQHRLLQEEQKRSERLLLSLLPKPVAEQLKENPRSIARRYSEATVLFADIVDFTRISAGLPPEKLVAWLNDLFTGFDRLTERYGLEKIKTVGDAYMAVAGVPTARSDHAEAAAELALALRMQVASRRAPNGEDLHLRIGMDTGPVVAGVIGTRKFSYDLWGDTVNVASRMESLGVPDHIQVTEATYRRISARYVFSEERRIVVKGMGAMTTYLLLERRTRAEIKPAMT
jgi:adenylate cyclase